MQSTSLFVFVHCTNESFMVLGELRLLPNPFLRMLGRE